MAQMTSTYVSLGNASPFSLLSAYSISGGGMISTNGDVGSQGAVSSPITYNPPGMLITDSATISAALNDATTVFNEGIILPPTHTYTTATTVNSLSPISPGVYKFNSSFLDDPTDQVIISVGSTVVLNGKGIYIFICVGGLNVGPQAVISLTGGASACDVYWLLVTNTGNTSVFNLYQGGSSENPSIFIGTVISDPANPSTSVGGCNIFDYLNYTGRVICFSQYLTDVGIVFVGGPGAYTFTLNAECVCFGKGTQIETIDGYKFVENLQNGDSIVTHGSIIDNTICRNSDSVKKIKWIGHYTDKDFSKNTYPVCFKKGSLGPNIPFEDLYVSPLHLIETNEGKMTCARNFINGTTVTWAKHLSSIDYYHIEFDEHLIVSANGLKAESLLGENNKFKFTY